jgi:fructose-1,6-bisphosphatase/inositol monophosphatase family enzyme
VLIGLEVSGEMRLGVAHFPALGEMVAAGRGEGCRWNGRPAQVSAVSRLSEALVVYTDAKAMEARAPQAWAQLRAASALQRGWGDCYGHCLVATGRAEVMLDPIMNPWDCAALLPILEEAGGTFTDWRGRARIDGGDAFSTNRLLFDETRAILSRPA